MEENRKPADHVPDRRLKLLTGDQQPRLSHQPPPQPLQSCPRCDSTNTKFCYYNNYSLSQPRYFCKTCRRYWTQGGTLRNVPVGGGCRKGKRAKTSGTATTSGGSNDLDHTQRLLAPLTLPPPPVSSSSQLMGTMTSLGRKEMGNNVNLSPMNPYYPNGGFFPSFAAMRTPNLGHPQPLINHLHQQQQPQHNFVGQFGIGPSSNANNNPSNSNMALLQGFSNNSLGHPQQHDQQQIFNASDPVGVDKMMNTIEPPYYLSAPNGPLIFGPSWNQNQLVNNNNVPSSSSNNSANAMNPNHQWPGFGPPP